MFDSVPLHFVHFMNVYSYECFASVTSYNDSILHIILGMLWQEAMTEDQNFTVIEEGGMGRTFVCLICGQKMCSKKDIKVHLRKHTGEKPHKCGICGAGFTQIGSMKRHIRTSHHQHE